MTLGRGYGVPFGGGPLIPTQEPATGVGEEPTVIDFTDEPDGPFPGTWEFIQRFTVGGAISGAPDPQPFPVYYVVSGGLAKFTYTQQPLVGDYSERGYVAAPTGIVVGRNCEMTAVFKAPPQLLDPTQDSFTFDCVLAVRASDDLSSFYGARVRAAWDNVNGWTLPVALEAVRGTPSGITVVGSFTFDPTAFRNLIDVWTLPTAQLRVRVVDGQLLAELNGVWQALASVPVGGSSKVALLAKAFHQRGTARTTPPTIAAIQFRTLRELSTLGPAAPISGDAVVDSPMLESQMFLPLRDLVDKGLFKRRGGRQWVATTDVQVQTSPIDREGETILFNEGDVVRAVEPYVGQDQVPCVRDLAYTRARREEGGN